MTTEGQLMFDVQPLVQPEARGLTIQQRFELFHEANPWVYLALESLAADLIKRGRRRIGVRMLWETVRWQYTRATTDPTSEFRANDHYHSRYVRLLIDNHPDWADVFATRELRAS
jgi:hypothetical protein